MFKILKRIAIRHKIRQLEARRARWREHLPHGSFLDQVRLNGRIRRLRAELER